MLKLMTTTGRAPSPDPAKHTTRLIDVAEAAGVSLTTASHSFSGKRHVSPETKQRIWRVATSLGYTNQSTQRNVAILLRPPESLQSSELGTTSFANLAGAMALSAMTRGFNVITARDIDDVAGSVSRLDGCILIAPNHQDDALRKILASGLPVVSYDPDPGLREFHWWVGAGYEKSTIQLLRHLRDSGAQRTALLVGGTDNMYRRGVISAYMHFVGSTAAGPLLRVADTGGGRAAAAAISAKLFRIASPPDAIMTSSSIFAAGVLDAALEASIAVPEELMIATMTDGPLAEFAEVPLTGLRIDTHRSAEAVLELLNKSLQGNSFPIENQRIDLQLIKRRSTR